MSYLELLHNNYPDSLSKEQSLQILTKYKDQLSEHEYSIILDSLCSHAIEEIYLNEENILLGIAQLQNEITLKEIVEMVKAS